MFATILGIFAPILLRFVGWFIDYLGAKDQSKKLYFMAVAAFETETNISVKLREDFIDGVEAARAELIAMKKAKDEKSPSVG